MKSGTRTTSVMFVPDDKLGNPYQTLLASSLKEQNVSVCYLQKHLSALILLAVGRIHAPEIIHIHWLDFYIMADNRLKMTLKSMITLGCLALLKVRGKKVFYTLHNLHSHESQFPGLERGFYRLFFKMVDGVFAHCHDAVRQLCEAYGQKLYGKTSVIPHGNYIDAYPVRLTRDDAREQSGLSREKLILLFVGQIRPYKGIVELLKAFREVDNDDIELVIAGKIASDQQMLYSLVERDSRVTLREGFVSEPDLAVLLSAADVFVSPFRNVLTSGSVVLAMSYGLPCIAPAVGCLPETLRSQRELLYDPEDEHALQQTLQALSGRGARLRELGAKNREYAQVELDWLPIAQKLAARYSGAASAEIATAGCACSKCVAYVEQRTGDDV